MKFRVENIEINQPQEKLRNILEEVQGLQQKEKHVDKSLNLGMGELYHYLEEMESKLKGLVYDFEEVA